MNTRNDGPIKESVIGFIGVYIWALYCPGCFVAKATQLADGTEATRIEIDCLDCTIESFGDGIDARVRQVRVIINQMQRKGVEKILKRDKKVDSSENKESR
jgi:hypothetical protein